MFQFWDFSKQDLLQTEMSFIYLIESILLYLTKFHIKQQFHIGAMKSVDIKGHKTMVDLVDKKHAGAELSQAQIKLTDYVLKSNLSVWVSVAKLAYWNWVWQNFDTTVKIVPSRAMIDFYVKLKILSGHKTFPHLMSVLTKTSLSSENILSEKILLG